MKNRIRLLGIAMAAVMAFSMTACIFGDDDDGGHDKGITALFEDLTPPAPGSNGKYQITIHGQATHGGWVKFFFDCNNSSYTTGYNFAQGQDAVTIANNLKDSINLKFTDGGISGKMNVTSGAGQILIQTTDTAAQYKLTNATISVE